jgi:hypothetical protein
MKNYLVTCLLVCCWVITTCAQTITSPTSSGAIIFLASTPGDAHIKSLFTIPADRNLDFIKWNLTLNPVASENRGAFSLELMFGEIQPNTQGFKGGGDKLSFTGQYMISASADPTFKGEEYHLKSNQLPTEVLLLKINDNLLHVMETQSELMCGNAGWSYTLNRVAPLKTSPSALTSQSTNVLPAVKDSDTLRVFNGRTLPNALLLEFNEIPDAGYQRIKWAFTLHRNPKTHKPATFQLRSVCVGEVSTVGAKAGTWEEMKTDSGQIVYVLKLNDDKASIRLLRGDDGVLFFLDEQGNPLVGNASHSYTLNAKSK